MEEYKSLQIAFDLMAFSQFWFSDFCVYVKKLMSLTMNLSYQSEKENREGYLFFLKER